MIEWLYIFLGLLSLLYLCLTWNHDHWKKKGIPYAKPLPGVGNMLEALLNKKCGFHVYIDIYRQFPKEPVCGFYEMCTPKLLLKTPELVQSVLVKDFSNFHDNEIYLSKEVDPYLNKNPFLSTGADWKINRGALTPAFTAAKMKSIFPQMKEVCQQLEDYLDGHLNENIEAKDLAFLYSSDIIANCAFGISGNSFTESDHVFKRMGKVMQEALHSSFMVFVFFTVPKISQILKLRWVPEIVYTFLKEAIIQVNNFRKKNNIVRNDFADFILASYNNKKLNENSDIVMLGHAITFFVEGIETSSIVESFVLYELAMNPHVQERLRDEILSNFSKRSDIDLETLQNLPYLQMVVSETLRKYPPGLVLRKLCTQTTILDVEGKPLKVDSGTPVVIPVYGFHHDPQYFPDPETFDPERFSEENISSRPQYVYLPFGEGPRMCIGIRFAVLQIKLFISSILLKYSVECCDKTTKQVILNKRDGFPSATEGLWIKFKKANLS